MLYNFTINKHWKFHIYCRCLCFAAWLRNSSSKCAMRVHTHIWFCLFWILIFQQYMLMWNFYSMQLVLQYILYNSRMHLIFFFFSFIEIIICHWFRVPVFFLIASCSQLWLQKQFLLYVIFWENKSTSDLSYYCSQFPHETMVSIVSMKFSLIQHDVNL